MLPSCRTENAEGQLVLKNRSPHSPAFIGKFAAAGDLIWRNYQVAANAVVLLKLALTLE